MNNTNANANATVLIAGNKPVILIPAYKPSSGLIDIATELATAGHDIIVINDGSPEGFNPIFQTLKTISHISVVAHERNRGKGQALKTGFSNYLSQFPDHTLGVITADCDGQHLVEDILKVALTLECHPHALCLGTRSFDQQVPLRSQLGNQLTRWIFRLFSGKSLQDTQTGLRGIPRHFMADLLKTRSSRYDFELDMLLLAAKKMPIIQCPIQTVYHNNNQSSHFNPLVDSFKIYFAFLRFLKF